MKVWRRKVNKEIEKKLDKLIHKVEKLQLTIEELDAKLNKHIEDMALNKVNIQFLRKQMDKVLEDIEELKDKNRDMYYNGNGVK